MNMEIAECRVCNAPIFLISDSSKLAEHEEWHEKQELKFRVLTRRLEILEGKVNRVE